MKAQNRLLRAAQEIESVLRVKFHISDPDAHCLEIPRGHAWRLVERLRKAIEAVKAEGDQNE